MPSFEVYVHVAMGFLLKVQSSYEVWTKSLLFLKNKAYAPSQNESFIIYLVLHNRMIGLSTIGIRFSHDTSSNLPHYLRPKK